MQVIEKFERIHKIFPKKENCNSKYFVVTFDSNNKIIFFPNIFYYLRNTTFKKESRQSLCYTECYANILIFGKIGHFKPFKPKPRILISRKSRKIHVPHEKLLLNYYIILMICIIDFVILFFYFRIE